MRINVTENRSEEEAKKKRNFGCQLAFQFPFFLLLKVSVFASPPVSEETDRRAKNNEQEFSSSFLLQDDPDDRRVYIYACYIYTPVLCVCIFLCLNFHDCWVTFVLLHAAASVNDLNISRNNVFMFYFC